MCVSWVTPATDGDHHWQHGGAGPTASGFDEREIDLISVGPNSAEYKRPEPLCGGWWPKVAQNHPEMRVAMVGDGPDRAELEALADELGVRERIDFMGKRSDVPDLLAKASVFWSYLALGVGCQIAMIECDDVGCGAGGGRCGRPGRSGRQ